MVDIPELESISGMDATFLYGETPTSPMHVGAVAVIEGSLEFETFKKTILSRIHMIPKLRKRLISIPMSIDVPYWVDDPEFDIDLHIRHVMLPRPGDWSDLRKMASDIFSKPLDHSRPLWEFTFVEGLDNLSQVKEGSVAIISKIHHVAIDGVGGAGLFAILFDLSPETRAIPEPKEFDPEPIPNELSLIVKSGLSFAKTPMKLPKLVMDSLTATMKAGFLTRTQHLDLPVGPFSAPRTPLNGIIAARRKWNTSIISLKRAKALKNIMGTTLNDVILTICSGALRRYLLEKKKLPKKPMVAMVPISIRQQGDQSLGNKLSAMLVQLATNIEDPIERLEAIYENTLKGKTYQDAMGAKRLSNIAEAVPFGVANQAARLYSRYNLAKLHNPVFNVVITNVPGPQIPIYLHGHKLHSVMGMAPIIDGMGLIITIFSYNGNITISPTSDVNSMPDLDVFSDYILESANELEEHILAYDKNKDKKKVSPASSDEPPVTDVYFEHIREHLKKDRKLVKSKSGIFQFFVKGDQPSDWTLNFNRAPGSIRRGRVKTFDLSCTIKEKYMMKIAKGDLDIETAIVQGRMVLSGNLDKAENLKEILGNIPVATS